MSSSIRIESSFTRDREICNRCNIFIKQQCLQTQMKCKLCNVINALYNLDYNYTSLLLNDLKQHKICIKHNRPIQYYSKITKQLSCSECNYEYIQQKRWDILEQLDLIERMYDEIHPYNINLNNMSLEQFLHQQFQIEQQINLRSLEQDQKLLQADKKEFQDQSLEQFKAQVNEYCEQSNIQRFQGTYGHYINTINCVKLEFNQIQNNHELQDENFNELRFLKLINLMRGQI
ncbi:hypothetical protein pb186bvf_007592 [Paramecium bursaria]